MPHSATSSMEQQALLALGPDLPALISRLQAAAQALLAWSGRSSATDQKPGAVAACGMAGQPCPGSAGETRCFRLSAALAQEEKELPRHAHARNITEALRKAHAGFPSRVGLMKNLEREAEFSGYALQMPAERSAPSPDLRACARCFLDDLQSVPPAAAL